MKIGILGLGSIGVRHARNLKMMGHQVFGYDPKDANTCLGNTVYMICRTPESALADRDALIIATPTISHYEDICRCLVNTRNVFVEKPLVSLTDMEFIAKEPELSSLFCGYMLRFHPVVKAAKQWIDAGNIGKPLWATFTCGQFNDRPDYLQDGVVLNWSHEIDLALYLLGPAKVVAASVHAVDGKDDIADFVLQHESGARSTIHLDYVTKNEIREGWIVGSEKNIGLDLLGRNISFGKMIQQFGGDWNDDYIDEIATFINLISPGGVKEMSPMATGEDGLRVLEICQQVRQMAGLE